MKKKVIRVVSVSGSLDLFLKDQMAYLSQWYDLIGVASPGKGHEIVRTSGIRTEEINIERPIRPWEDLKSLWRLYWFFRKEKPWMVHSITPKAGLLSMMAGWLAGVPVRVHTFTGLLFPWKKGILKLILKTTDRLTCFFANYINPEGFGVKIQMEKGRITAKPLTVLGHGHLTGVDLDRFSSKGKRESMRSKIGADDSSIVFAFSGRLVKDKGVVELQKAFKALLLKHTNVYLLLMGEEESDMDPLPPECIQWLESCSRVYLTGRVDNVPEWLEAADVFVFPSHREGMPTALLEAGAMGLPVIASNICGCNEIIENQKNGMLVHPCNEDSLMKALDFFLENRDLYTAMSFRLRKNVTDYWNSKKVRDALRCFYSSLEN